MGFWNDPLKIAADWLMGIFTGWGMPEFAAQILIGFLGIFVLIALLMLLDIFLVWSSAKLCRASRIASVRTAWVHLD